MPRTPDAAKALAKELRAKLATNGTQIGHARALELVAQQFGFRDWNAMTAQLEPTLVWSVGDRVRGTYLSQPFTGSVLVCIPAESGWHHIEVQLDQAIDVVTSDSFSNMRRRVRGLIGPNGYSRDKTSDGRPHLQLETSAG